MVLSEFVAGATRRTGIFSAPLGFDNLGSGYAACHRAEHSEEQESYGRRGKEPGAGSVDHGIPEIADEGPDPSVDR